MATINSIHMIGAFTPLSLIWFQSGRCTVRDREAMFSLDIIYSPLNYRVGYILMNALVMWLTEMLKLT